MYQWVDATWNPVQGSCPHRCSYCYGKRIWWLAGLEHGQVLKEEYLQDDLYAPIKGKKSPHTLFICSTTDLFASKKEWIKAVLKHCREFPLNTYLLQSKNPINMIGHIFPPATIVGTTIESDFPYQVSRAPAPADRVVGLAYLKKYQLLRTMVSIEPIMQFNLKQMVYYIKLCEPDFVSIGANTNRAVKLPEPKAWEVEFLIKELSKFTEVRTKPNLTRILG